MSSLNEVNLIGNVGKDPEIRSTLGGDRIATFSIATSEKWKDRASGEMQEKTEWHNIVVFGDGLAGVIEKYVTKGTKLYVKGALKTRKWQDQSGNDRYSTEVVLSGPKAQLVLLGGKEGGGEGRRAAPSGGGRRQEPARAQENLDDDIPF